MRWGAFEPGFEVLQFGDVRHEQEYKVWRDVKLPAGKILITGVPATKVFDNPIPSIILQYNGFLKEDS